MKNIMRLYKPSEGSVKIFGQDVTELEDEDLENVIKKMGILFQNGALLNSCSIYDNISIPFEFHTSLPKKMIDRIIRKKLDLVELSHAIHLFPSQLSGGMIKRAAMARAMALDPLILFCDEPSAGLDPITCKALDELFLKLKSQLNITIIMVTHELASIHRIADHILFLDQGEVLFDGPLREAVQSKIPFVYRFFNQ